MPSLGWGGTRNRRDRTSHYLKDEQVRSLVEAALYAGAIGLPFNRHTIIHLGKLGIDDADAAKAIGRYLKLMRERIVRGGGRTAFLWVRENGDSGIGTHVHILWHLPESQSLGSATRRWANHIARIGYQKGAVRTRRIAGRVDGVGMAPRLYRLNLANVLRYVLKGATQSVAREWGLARYRPGGCVQGKRCGWSENIGVAARERAPDYVRLGRLALKEWLLARDVAVDAQ